MKPPLPKRPCPRRRRPWRKDRSRKLPSFPIIRASEAADLKALGQAVKDWKAKHAEGKLAVFGHADAVGEELSNKQLSERRAKSVQAYLAKDVKPWEELYGEEKWGLACVQELLKHLGHDP